VTGAFQLDGTAGASGQALVSAGGANTPTWSTLGTMASQSASAVAITGGTITGITDLTVADGGTGASTLSANAVLLGNGTSALQTVAPSTSGNVLTSNGSTWTSSPLGVIGVGQTWQNVLGSRAFATTYTNSTGKPILVNVTGALSTTGTDLANMYLEVDSVIVARSGGRGEFTDYHFVSAIVPNGSSYKAVTDGGDDLIYWAELR
jgi:hypothetical protein